MTIWVRARRYVGAKAPTPKAESKAAGMLGMKECTRCGVQARRMPQEGQEAWEERSRRVAPQKGQTVSEAGGIEASFSRSEGSLEVRRRWMSVRMAAMGKAMRITQWKTGSPGSAGSGGTAHIAKAKMSRTTRPAHSARRASTVSTRAARAAGIIDAKIAAMRMTAADPINGTGPGSWSS